MKSHLDTKYLIGLGIVLIGIILFYLFSFQIPKSNVAPLVSTGRITEIKEGGIIVKELAGEENMEFMITLDTVFQKSVIVITENQANSGESFAPETQTLPGKVSDLAKDMLVRIKAAGNSAIEINYTTYDFQF